MTPSWVAPDVQQSIFHPGTVPIESRPCPNGDPADDRRSRHYPVRRSQALGGGARPARVAAVRAARRLPGAARFRQQQDLVEHHAAHQGAERLGLRGAALRHARLRRQRGRIRPRDLPGAGRGHAQRAHLPCAAPRGRSRAHRPHRIELRRRGGDLYRRRRSTRRRGHLQRRLGRRRAQVPRPAQEPAGVGAVHRHAQGGSRAPRPHRQIADGAALRHRADPAASAQQPRQQFHSIVPGGDRAEHVRLPRRRRGRPHRAAAAAAAARGQRFGHAHRTVDRAVQARRPADRAAPNQRRRSFHVRRRQYARLGSAARLARRLFSGDGGGEESGGGTAPVRAAHAPVSRARRLARAGKMPRSAHVVVLALALLGISSIAEAADPALVEAARKEGKVVWYTTLIVNQAVRPLKSAFEKAYPGIELQYTRADEAPTAAKILAEAQAGRVQADIFDGISNMVPLKRAGLVVPHGSPSAGKIPADLKDREGYWISILIYVFSPGINTTLVSKEQAPKTYQDLLDPRWRGKMAWNPGST